MTSHALTRTPAADLTTPAAPAAALVAAWLSGRSERTRRAYAADLADFCTFLGVPDTDAAAAVLLSLPHGEANGCALAYRSHLLARELAPATVNRRLAALRSLVQLARVLGRVPWTLEVENVRAEKYRDTRGPGRDGYLALLAELEGERGPRALRDAAMVRLLFDLALRRAEVVALDLADIEREADGRPVGLWVLRKGKREKKRRTLPPNTGGALLRWIGARGEHAGPLFVNFDRSAPGGRLTGTSLYRTVRELGKRAGLPRAVRPHGLRHAAITEALERTNGNVEAVQDFSGHADPRVLMRYNDNRKDRAGEIAALIAA